MITGTDIINTEKRLREWIFVVALTLPAILLAYKFITRVPDPEYQGKKLSSYLSDALLASPPRSPAQHAAAQQNAQAALRELGPRAVPFLANWLSEADSDLKRKARTFCNRLAIPCPHFFVDHSDSAALFLNAIPEHGAPIAPLLI